MNNQDNTGELFTRLAVTGEDLRAAQSLRYQVFVEEMGGDGPLVDHAAKLECDRFDDHAAHLLLCDPARPEGETVVGTYRLMTAEMAASAGQFYCEDEYDLTALRQSGLRLLELGRSCVHPDYRAGPGLKMMWSGLAAFVTANDIDVAFGVASFHGTDKENLSHALSLLHHRHLAPPHLRVTAKGETAFDMAMCAPDAIDRVAAVRQIPALIKGYLRLGGVVGQGAFVDHAFNTTDICLILQRDALNVLQQDLLAKGPRGG
ncbi:MAG: GNAT family N-acyltransferase [Pseudomonadota bacterium]